MKRRHATKKIHQQLSKAEDLVLFFLRAFVGFVFVAHGTMKLADPMETTQQMAALGFPLPGIAMALATCGELAGGLGLMLGAFTRLASLGPLFTMLGAIFAVHWENGLFASDGGWEYPLTLFLVSLVFAVRGGGKYSLDAWAQRVRFRGLAKEHVSAE